MLTDWMFRLRALFRPTLVDRELDHELRFHLENQIEALVRAGLDPAEARRQARLEFGGLDQVKEECRDARGIRWADEAVQDVRYAIRLLAKDRAFCVVAAMTLALGIGANTAMFSVIEAVLLKPLPYRDPERLVWITENSIANNISFPEIDAANLAEWQSGARSLEAIGAIFTGDGPLSGGEPAMVRFAATTESVVRLFGVTPVLGRDFSSEELGYGPPPPGIRAPRGPYDAPTTGVAILSDDLFRRRFGADTAVLGQNITIGTTSYTLIGVLPPTFRLPIAPSLQLGIGPRTDVDVFLSASLTPTYRGPGALLARLQPGVSLDTARLDLEIIRRSANDARPRQAQSSELELRISALHDYVVGGKRRVLLVLWAAVGFVLLVAAVNVTNLLLARSFVRARETALRAALGATRWRLVRQMITESLVLAGLGGLAGVALAYGALRVFTHVNAADIPRMQDATVNWRVLLFTAACVRSAGSRPVSFQLSVVGRASWM
jgi:predicted permease